MASFLRELAISKSNMLGIHVFLGGVASLEDMVCRIFDELLKEARAQTWYEKVVKLFGNHVSQVGLFDISISFTPPEKDLQALVNDFPKALDSLLDKLKDDKKGLFIILDDIDTLAGQAQFANWYKSLVDKVATRHGGGFPVFIMLVGLPEMRDLLSDLQPSLMRVFRMITIERLSDSEVRTFMSKAFERVGTKVDPQAMSWLVNDSNGLPNLMHEIGDAVFWADTDGTIDTDDAAGGILKAADNVGQKYLDPKVYRTLRSETYRGILRKLGKRELATSRYFKKADLESNLTDSEKKVFYNFLRRMRELGVIESDIEAGKGAYKFVNSMYPVYIWLESRRFEKRRRNG